ncbi:protease II [Escherichia coli]|uniref:Protease II n=1 Tax=Escherichia coli TaxID=562 RepID=A0A376J3D0_ECOLX|nr:protease II [Escherichia coli]
MPSRLFFCLAAKITNTALITTSIGFICVPTAAVKNFGLYRTRMRDEQQWEELIPPRDNIMLEGVYAVYRLGWWLKSVSAG